MHHPIANADIHGDNDTSTPIELTGRKTAGLIRGSRLKVYDGTAHGLPITHMDCRSLLSRTYRPGVIPRKRLKRWVR